MFRIIEERMDKTVGIKPVAILLLALLILPGISIPTEAHMPGASPPPEFELESIVIDDGGTVIEITIDDVGNYHNERAKDMKREMLRKQHPDWTEEMINNKIEEEFAGADGKCPCTSCAFRAILLGIIKWSGATRYQNVKTSGLSAIFPRLAHVTASSI